MVKRIFGAIGPLLFLLPGVAGADSIEIGATEWALISNPKAKNEVRLLVHFSLPSGIQKRKIDTAYFDWPMVLATTDEELPWTQVVVFEAGKQWDQKTVSWNQPWTEKGGDLRTNGEAEGSYLLVPGRANLARFDITRTVQAWASGARENFGLIVLVRGDQTAMSPVENTSEGGFRVGPVLKIWFEDDGGTRVGQE